MDITNFLCAFTSRPSECVPRDVWRLTCQDIRMASQCKTSAPQAGPIVVLKGLDSSVVAELRAAAARHGRSLDAEIVLALMAHVGRLSSASGTTTPGARGSRTDRGVSAQFERLPPMKKGLHMLLEILPRQGENDT